MGQWNLKRLQNEGLWTCWNYWVLKSVPDKPSWIRIEKSWTDFHNFCKTIASKITLVLVTVQKRNRVEFVAEKCNKKSTSLHLAKQPWVCLKVVQDHRNQLQHPRFVHLQHTIEKRHQLSPSIQLNQKIHTSSNLQVKPTYTQPVKKKMHGDSRNCFFRSPSWGQKSFILQAKGWHYAIQKWLVWMMFRDKGKEKNGSKKGWKVGLEGWDAAFFVPCGFASVIFQRLVFQFFSKKQKPRFHPKLRSFQVCSRGSPSIGIIHSFGVRHMQSPTALVVTWFLHFYATGISPNAPGLHSVQIPYFLRARTKTEPLRQVATYVQPLPYFSSSNKKTTQSLDETTRSFTICRLGSPCCLRFCELSMSLPRSAGESNARFHPHEANR